MGFSEMQIAILSLLKEQNPQKPGYRSSAPQVQRRVTRAEQLRIRRRKAIIGVLCVLAVLVVGIVLSINLLFKPNF